MPRENPTCVESLQPSYVAGTRTRCHSSGPVFMSALVARCPAITRYIDIRLESLASRRWCGTPAHAPLITTSLLEPLARAHVQLAIQLCRRFLAMYEVAEAAAHTALAAVETTAGFAEIGDGREFAVDGAAGVPAAVERVARFLGVFLVLEAHVDVADKI
jgi:hypothetical protein